MYVCYMGYYVARILNVNRDLNLSVKYMACISTFSRSLHRKVMHRMGTSLHFLFKLCPRTKQTHEVRKRAKRKEHDCILHSVVHFTVFRSFCLLGGGLNKKKFENVQACPTVYF